MRQIFEIYKRDLKRIRKNIIAFVVIVGICVMPALYAWFNIAANWDPYGNTSGIQVAVANLDEGYEIEAFSLNIGEEIVNNLKDNEQIGWVFVQGEEEAVEKVRSGAYYAAVVIPEDFSKKMTSVLSDSIERPEIQYYINEKKNAIAPKITDKGVSVIQQQVNTTFISVATETIASILNLTTKELEDSGTNLADHFIQSMEKVNSDLEQYEVTIDMIRETLNGVQGLIDTTQLVLPKVDVAVGETYQSLVDARETLDQSRDSMRRVIDTVGEDLDQAAALCGSLTDAADSLLSLAEKGSDLDLVDFSEIQKIAQSIVDVNERNVKRLAALNEKLPKPLTAVSDLIDKINANTQKIKDIQSDVNRLSQDIEDTQKASKRALRDLASLSQDAQTQFLQLQDTYRESIEPGLTESLDSLDHLAGSVSEILEDRDGISDAGEILNGISKTLVSGSNALDSAKTVIENTRSRLSDLIYQVNSVGADERWKTLTEIIQNDPNVIGDFMSSPVQIETKHLYPIENYGSAMAPFYSSLAIWVGATILVAILKTRVDEDKKLKGLSPAQCYLGRYLLFLTLGVVQATIICLGDLFFLGIQCENPMLFMIAGWISGLVYTNIIYTFAVSFSDIGKALAVILLVIQVAGAGGTFPIEVTPSFFQHLYPFLPFTYGINAMRETVAGIYGMHYLTDLLCLLVFLIPSLILGLVLRTPLIHLNRFFDKRLEDTHLM